MSHKVDEFSGFTVGRLLFFALKREDMKPNHFFLFLQSSKAFPSPYFQIPGVLKMTCILPHLAGWTAFLCYTQSFIVAGSTSYVVVDN